MKRATADSTLGKSVASQQPIINLGNTSIKPGYVEEKELKYDYRTVITDCRHFYHNDPIAGTVMNRLCEISITDLRNRRKNKNSRNAVSDEVIAYYNAVSTALKPFLRQMALEYVLHGIIIPEYTTVRKMGNRATDKLGRTRYWFPDNLWCRNIDNIDIVKLPTGAKRVLYLRIPPDEIKLIKEKGGKDDAKKALYQYYVDNHPEYVQAINDNKTKFELKDVYPIYRKLTSYNTYPLPYLVNAIDALKHKSRLKKMDMSITARIIEAVRQIKVGNDMYPADDDDLRAEHQSFIAYGSHGEKVFNYFTNHTVEMVWSYPPFEALLSEGKYGEVNREIFFSLGFPRIWVNGETEKSNASDNKIASVGPLATIEEIRDSVLSWVKYFYGELAELNNFDRIPDPYFTKIDMSDTANLIQYAGDMMDRGAISKETISELYNKSWEEEQAQIEAEKEIAPEPEPVTLESNSLANQNTQQSIEPENPTTEGVPSTN